MNQAADTVPQITEECKPRFWAKVDKDGPIPDPVIYGDIGRCWVWTAGRFKTKRGALYGAFKLGGQNRIAHRISWRIHHGDIPDGLWVLHNCDNPSCVRVSHLHLGTHRENTDDMVSRNRQASGDKIGKARPYARGAAHWVRGRENEMPRGESSASAILTEATVREIRRMAAEGIKQIEISRLLGVGYPNVVAIVSRRNWKHIIP